MVVLSAYAAVQESVFGGNEVLNSIILNQGAYASAAVSYREYFKRNIFKIISFKFRLKGFGFLCAILLAVNLNFFRKRNFIIKFIAIGRRILLFLQ